MPGAFLDQGCPIAREVAQFALLSLGNEAGFEQAMVQQISNPFGIFDVGLASGDGLHMLGIDHDHLKESF